MATTRWFSWWHRLPVVASLLASQGTASALPADARAASAAVQTAPHDDAAIRKALSLLPTPVQVTIEVVRTPKLSVTLRRAIKNVCAYTVRGVPRIYINSSCRTYEDADDTLLAAMKLAAILRHELAHLDGADEIEALLIEARTFRELLQTAPVHLLTPGIEHAGAIEWAAARAARRARKTRTASD